MALSRVLHGHQDLGRALSQNWQLEVRSGPDNSGIGWQLCQQAKQARAVIYRKFGKRLADLVLAMVASPFVCLILGIVALLVRVKLGSPVLFRQQRPGLRGSPFTLYKFRTMTNARGADGSLLPDEQRVTPFGSILRSTSLDELPELLNVIKGDMTLVGPRPLLMQYLDRYTPEQMRRYEVKPGITGWAQVNGRNAISWEQKLAHDTWYVDHLSPSLDLKILLLSPWKILNREGINPPGQAATPEFLGTSQGQPPSTTPGED